MLKYTTAIQDPEPKPLKDCPPGFYRTERIKSIVQVIRVDGRPYASFLEDGADFTPAHRWSFKYVPVAITIEWTP